MSLIWEVLNQLQGKPVNGKALVHSSGGSSKDFLALEIPTSLTFSDAQANKNQPRIALGVIKPGVEFAQLTRPNLAIQGAHIDASLMTTPAQHMTNGRACAYIGIRTNKSVSEETYGAPGAKAIQEQLEWNPATINLAVTDGGFSDSLYIHRRALGNTTVQDGTNFWPCYFYVMPRSGDVVLTENQYVEQIIQVMGDFSQWVTSQL